MKRILTAIVLIVFGIITVFAWLPRRRASEAYSDEAQALVTAAIA